MGLTHCSRDWIYLSANPACARIVGKSLDKIVGRPIVEVIGEEAAAAIKPYVERALTGEHVTYESQVPYAGAGGRFIHVSYSPDTDDAGQIVGWVACITDITERKRLENELRAAINVRDEFMSIASHELKTPLTALHMQLDLLKRFTSTELGPSNKISILANSTYESVHALADLLDDLLDVTRIRVGKLPLDKKEMDLRTAVLENVELIRETAMRRGSHITVQARAPVRGIWDPRRVNQILSNLLSNAIKYGEGKLIEVKLLVDSGTRMARIEVQDHGIGISKEMQAIIFERFQRAVSSKSITGLGLGLYIVRQVVEAHGGSITVASEVGQGAIFTVSLPLERSNSAVEEVK